MRIKPIKLQRKREEEVEVIAHKKILPVKADLEV
jgi:hypothetical protein